ncbi:two-component sensor histidine kinase [Rhizobium tropici]|uniref:histidine kinase n=1 Tax=Rhizobium tropici TaxID=398 RepID=A0A329Y1G6_RHITR|nr:ATP-binding protein [Rhizobium tropici]RAX37741.1 two-component sensor histidine kinase [Rhizobium tropici]
MPRRQLTMPKTLRGQIIVIILAALVVVIFGGRTLEKRVRDSYAVPNLENAAEQVKTIATLLSNAPASERNIILENAHRAGLDVSLAPNSVVESFTTSPEMQGIAEKTVDFLFPPDGDPPLGGWRAFKDGRRVIAESVDDDTMLLFFGFPDAILTTTFLTQGFYYFTAVITLITFFFVFAIKTVTEPIKRISKAAIEADINDGSQIFEERGSIEITSLARALNGMHNRIQTMVEARTRMLRGISHDVRTPLTRLRLRTERMEDNSVREMLLADIDHIDKLLTESLNYLRDDYATEEIERVDVASILQTVCSDFSDVGFKISYAGPNKLIAHCRPTSITRAVTNLCANAVKFAQQVDVQLIGEAEGFTIRVIDDGPGIPDSLREKVFEPFFKVDAARKDSDAGFGLGLSIVADIARSHKGTTQLCRRETGGLIAELRIPNLAHGPSLSNTPI